jgi:S-adenosylmethionine:tRNA ribosyltransferase-isomerase
MLSLKDFNYSLPQELIAQTPIRPRDHSRLLKIDRASGAIEHSRFDKLTDFLKAGDVLVINNSKVFPARLHGLKEKSGGKVEVLLHQMKDENVWECLLKGKPKLGAVIKFKYSLVATLIKIQTDGTYLLRFNFKGEKFWQIINRLGEMPLPPYIEPDHKKKNNQSRYQTVYAHDKQLGSVAAPTAGLHFTKRMLKKLKDKGVVIVPVTLHVGLGTFAAVREDDIRLHKMHQESFFLSGSAMKEIRRAKKNGRRLIAVGTTSCRTLEAIAQTGVINNWPVNKDYYGSTKIFIYPGYKFLLINALITNFHLPQSTLLMLVAAFGRLPTIKKAYQMAVQERYRFYSYGDAMIIL